MKIEEFLTKNPLFDLFDIEFIKINGVYDEKTLDMYDKSINSDKNRQSKAA